MGGNISKKCLSPQKQTTTTSVPHKQNKNQPVFVNESIEGKAILPTGGEVANVDIRVASSLHLTPQQQGILGRLGFTVVSLFYCNVLNLIKKNNITFWTLN